MKLSISLPDEDVEALDRYAREAGLPTRSAAVQHAVRLLGSAALESAYGEAWDEWADAGEAQRWDAVAPDGLHDASR